MTRTTALLLSLCATLLPATAGCESPPERELTLDERRELPEPRTYASDWKGYHELGKRHCERAYAIESASQKAYHFDMAIASFQRAKELREETLTETPELERGPVEADIELIQKYLLTVTRDRPVYTGPPYKPPSQRY